MKDSPILPPYRATKEGVEIFIRATPGASKTRIDGIFIDVNQRSYLKVYVTDAPEGGKANNAIIHLLSKTLNVPKSSITQVNGQTMRLKMFMIDGLSCDDDILVKITTHALEKL